MIVRFRPLAVLFALFLAAAMVRILPFSPRRGLDLAEADAAAGIGKQVVFIGFFAAIGVTALRNAWRSGIVVPVPFLLLMGFAALSLSWSAVPLLASRRLALTLLVATAILMTTIQLRPKTVLDLLRWVAVALAVATLLTGLADPSAAIHQPGDPESSVVGAWRGVFYHKNHAGGVIGLAVVLVADDLIRKRRMSAAAVLAVTVVALVLTRSKTSEIGAVLAIVVLLAFRGANILAGSDPARAALLRWSVAVGGVAALVAVWFAAGLQHYVLDPEAFTGRGQLWGLVAELIAKRPLIGHGYESVFQAGDASAMAQMSSLGWIRHAPHSHNGVLDLLVSVGAIGLILYAWALFVDPWRRIARLPDTVRDGWQPVVAALLCYAFIHSLTEGKSFSADSVQWVILIVVLGISLRLTAVIRADAAPAPLPSLAAD